MDDLSIWPPLVALALAVAGYGVLVWQDRRRDRPGR